MKPVDRKDLNEVSGGFSPDDDCFPPIPIPDYPPIPIGPLPEPVIGPGDPVPFNPVK
jgi:hypothetical protein